MLRSFFLVLLSVTFCFCGQRDADWSPCSGNQSQTRSWSHSPYEFYMETRPCNTSSSSCECQFSEWAQWSRRSKGCGDVQLRSRTCLHMDGGDDDDDAPLIGEMCSKEAMCITSGSCGMHHCWDNNGEMSHVIAAEDAPTNNKFQTPAETKEHHTKVGDMFQGAEDEGYDRWSEWTFCYDNKTGTQTRSWSQSKKLHVETRPCNVTRSHCDCHFTEWAQWSRRRDACGVVEMRSRTCLRVDVGNNDDDDDGEFRLVGDECLKEEMCIALGLCGVKDCGMSHVAAEEPAVTNQKFQPQEAEGHGITAEGLSRMAAEIQKMAAGVAKAAEGLSMNTDGHEMPADGNRMAAEGHRLTTEGHGMTTGDRTTIGEVHGVTAHGEAQGHHAEGQQESEWSQWSPCYGNQSQMRSWRRSSAEMHLETRPCNATRRHCDCQFSEWAQWSRRSEGCGAVQTRSRTCLHMSGGDDDDDDVPLIGEMCSREEMCKTSDPCGMQDCWGGDSVMLHATGEKDTTANAKSTEGRMLHGGETAGDDRWSEWSPCLDNETQTRSWRSSAEMHMETRPCNVSRSHCECQFSEWARWSGRNEGCGTVYTRSRTCLRTDLGNHSEDTDDDDETRMPGDECSKEEMCMVVGTCGMQHCWSRAEEMPSLTAADNKFQAMAATAGAAPATAATAMEMPAKVDPLTPATGDSVGIEVPMYRQSLVNWSGPLVALAALAVGIALWASKASVFDKGDDIEPSQRPSSPSHPCNQPPFVLLTSIQCTQ